MTNASVKNKTTTVLSILDTKCFMTQRVLLHNPLETETAVRPALQQLSGQWLERL